MKKVILFLSMLLITATTYAQTIHWLTFIDTKDENVGEIDILGRKVLYGRYINLINAALATKGYTAKIYDYYDSRLTPENCKAAVQNLRCQPNDIIMFYYIGHGGRAINDKSTVYPQMCLGQFSNERMVPLDWVYNQLKSKGARLSVTIGMCCNSESRGLTSKIAPQFSPNNGNTYMTDTEAARIQELCLNYKGNVLVTSASPGQTSVCAESNLGYFDTYTNVLVHAFDALQKGELTPSWDALLAETKSTVNEVTKNRQTPIFETHVTKVSAPQQTAQKEAPKKENVEKPAPKQKENSSEESTEEQSAQELFNKIATIYDYLADTSIHEDDRIDMEQWFTQTYGTLFSEVKVLSQDNDCIIDRSTFEDFNGRVATSRLLRKVAVCGAIKGANGKLALAVKEIYKK